MYTDYIDKARNTQAIADIRMVELVMEKFEAENGNLPNNLAQVGKGNLLDPWGNNYQYLNIITAGPGSKPRKDHFLVPVNSDYDLYSMGKDGKSKAPFTAHASRDDIVRANDGMYVGLVSEY